MTIKNVVLVGAGRQAHHRLPSLLALGVPVPVIVEPDEMRARTLIESFATAEGLEKWAARGYEIDPAVAARFVGEVIVDAALENCLKEVGPDGVMIVTPHHMHCEQAGMALRHGCHVFMEKPVSPDLGDAEQLLARADSSGKTVAVGYQLPYHLRELVEWVRDSRDPVRSAVIRWWRTAGIPVEPHFWDDAERTGALIDLGGHCATAVLPFMASRPTWVRAELYSDSGVRLYGEQFRADDQFLVEVLFADGSMATMDGRWAQGISDGAPELDRLERTSLELVHAGGTIVQTEVPVQKAADYVPNLAAMESIIRHDRPGGGEAQYGPAPVAYTSAMIDQARDWLEGGSLTDLRTAVDAERIVAAAHRSARVNGGRGDWVRLSGA